MRAREGKGRPEWYPSLRLQLRWLVANDRLGLSGLELRAFRMFSEEDPRWLNLERVDVFLHNRYMSPTPQELRRLANILGPAWTELLSERPVKDESQGTKNA
jgi:hypothetical protein